MTPDESLDQFCERWTLGRQAQRVDRQLVRAVQRGIARGKTKQAAAREIVNEITVDIWAELQGILSRPMAITDHSYGVLARLADELDPRGPQNKADSGHIT